MHFDPLIVKLQDILHRHTGNKSLAYLYIRF